MGHHNVIEDYMDEYELEIVIGSSEKSRTGENPLNAEERRRLIEACFPEADIVLLEDEEQDDEGHRRWIRKLEEKIDAEILITQNELVVELAEEHTDLKVVKQEMRDEDIYSGTEVRRRIRSGEEWRYLVPKCAKPIIEEFEEVIKDSGVQYSFEPGWKRKNAYHGTADDS